nr:MAG TPA: hypothetical protein [Caudoviricetes sp.]
MSPSFLNRTDGDREGRHTSGRQDTARHLEPGAGAHRSARTARKPP